MKRDYYRNTPDPGITTWDEEIENYIKRSEWKIILKLMVIFTNIYQENFIAQHPPLELREYARSCLADRQTEKPWNHKYFMTFKSYDEL